MNTLHACNIVQYIIIYNTTTLKTIQNCSNATNYDHYNIQLTYTCTHVLTELVSLQTHTTRTHTCTHTLLKNIVSLQMAAALFNLAGIVVGGMS